MQKITILAFVAIIFLCTSCASLLGPKEQDKYMKGMMLNDAERIIKEQLEPKKKPFEKTKDFEARVETSFKNASRLEFTLESIHQPKFGSRYAAKYGSKCELELKYSKSSVLSFRKDYYDADSEEWIVPLCNVLNIVQSGEKFETIRCNDAYSDTDTSVGFLVSNKRNSSALLKLIDKPGDAFYREDNKIYARIYEPICVRLRRCRV